MELRATMELGDGRGSQLGEEDSPFIVKEQIQPLSTNSACDMRFSRGTPTKHCGTTAGTVGAKTSPDALRQGAVEPLARYYRAPLRYYRKAGIV